jgi:hypothetical protein
VWHYFPKVLVKLHKIPIAVGRDLQFGSILKSCLVKERQYAFIAGQNLLITKVLEYLTYRIILDHPAKNFLQILIVILFFQKVCLVWMFAILYWILS